MTRSGLPAHRVRACAALSGSELGIPNGAAEALAEARKVTVHVEAYLVGRRPILRRLRGYYGFGDENEAVICAIAIAPAWKQHPTAVRWLEQACSTWLGQPVPRRRGRGPRRVCPPSGVTWRWRHASLPVDQSEAPRGPQIVLRGTAA